MYNLDIIWTFNHMIKATDLGDLDSIMYVSYGMLDCILGFNRVHLRTDPRLLHNIADVSGQKFYADNEIKRLDLLKSAPFPCLSSVDALRYVTLPLIYNRMTLFQEG